MYIFDLDGDEHMNAEDHVPHRLYSVDAMHEGLSSSNYSLSDDFNVDCRQLDTLHQVGTILLCFMPDTYFCDQPFLRA